MAGYQPPFTITNRMVGLVSEIAEKIGRLDRNKSLDMKPHLRRNNRIRSIHSSLAIEANSLPIDAVRGVIDGRTVLGPEKEIQEVKNAYKAYDALGRFDPFSIDELKRLHSEEVHPLILSSVFHYEFVFIHPFADGNGRMARLWQTSLLCLWNPVFQYLPIESRIHAFQSEYYEAIARCHNEGNSNGFIIFMLEKISETLDLYLQQAGAVDGQISAYVRRLLDAMEYDVPYTAKEIMALLHLKSKETLRKHYIHPALEMGLIVMCDPDKPTSRNQAYVKK